MLQIPKRSWYFLRKCGFLQTLRTQSVWPLLISPVLSLFFFMTSWVYFSLLLPLSLLCIAQTTAPRNTTWKYILMIEDSGGREKHSCINSVFSSSGSISIFHYQPWSLKLPALLKLWTSLTFSLALSSFQPPSFPPHSIPHWTHGTLISLLPQSTLYSVLSSMYFSLPTLCAPGLYGRNLCRYSVNIYLKKRRGASSR